MKRLCLSCVMLLAVQATVVQAGPAINGIRNNLRVNNGFSTTTQALVNSNSVNPGFISLLETNWVDDGIAGPGNNRHDFLLSPDNGVSPQVFDLDDSFTIMANVTLSAGSNAPRKEAGIRLNSPVTGDVLLIINSDAGEIVAFGGGAPFKLFGNNGGGNGYVPGSTILLGMTVRAGGDGSGGIANTIEYFIDRGAGIETSGALPYSNLEKGSLNYAVALYNQSTPNQTNTAEFVSTTFSNIRYSATPIPEPSTLALGAVALVGLIAARRR